jgi:pyridoxamine 5'-phosphate oxidase
MRAAYRRPGLRAGRAVCEDRPVPRRPDLPPLRREDLGPDPIAQFRAWLAAAEREVPLHEAMTLATVDASGDPDARMVLLKGVDQRGFRFFTNATSTKGRQLAQRPRAALVLYWRELDRQVRVRGGVEALGAEDSDAYFATRPPESQLGAWASPQSEPIDDRAVLDERLERVRERFGSEPIERPDYWGGYLVVPDEVEFWQGQVGRLHDRFRYSRTADGWRLERLAP